MRRTTYKSFLKKLSLIDWTAWLGGIIDNQPLVWRGLCCKLDKDSVDIPLHGSGRMVVEARPFRRKRGCRAGQARHLKKRPEKIKSHRNKLRGLTRVEARASSEKNRLAAEFGKTVDEFLERHSEKRSQLAEAADFFLARPELYPPPGFIQDFTYYMGAMYSRNWRTHWPHPRWLVEQHVRELLLKDGVLK